MGFKELLKAKSLREYSEAKKDPEKMSEIAGRSKKDVVKNISGNKCASCGNKLSFTNRFILKDGSYICASCINKAGVSMGGYDVEYFKNNVTFDTLFDDHSVQKYKPTTHGNNANISKPNTNAIKCPKCNSTNVQFMQQDKKAFSIGKAVGGTILTGGVGALAGFAGKKGKKQWFCQNCNSIFETK